MQAEPLLAPEPRPVPLASLPLIEQLRWEAARLRAMTLSDMTIDTLHGVAGRLDAIADALGAIHD